MSKFLLIKKKIKKFNLNIRVSGDKSLSIRWVLFSSIADGVSKAHNLLMSDDVYAAIDAIKKLGVKVTIKKKICLIIPLPIYKFITFKLLIESSASELI